uniref:FMP27 C-terminal domain-containing protein n=1 Tax=Globisporangium ultimum (strain ATCC 200006 / CBS 805.95 / DAOM BR144) TaxID=431595 RepID=K3X0V3_GLOUD
MAVFKAKLLFDKRYQSSSKVNLMNQKGMLTVRAESGPLIRVLGQKLRVLDVLEVSIFPEISNMIIIQLASDFYELVYKFFFEQLGPQDHHDIDSEQVLFGRKAGGDNDARGHISPSMRGRAATSATPSSPVAVTSKARRKSVQMSGSTNSLLIDPSASFVSNVSTASMPVSQSVTLDNASVDDDDSSADGCELFYFKYVRIGNVRLRINCNGFFVNLSDFDLDLPPYVCQSKLCTTKKLLQKFESHLKWYVTKESASSGLSHFKNKFLKWTPTSSSSTTEKKDKNKKDEDSSTMNAQVLFGPYSGATT